MKCKKVYLSMGSNIGNSYYFLLNGIFQISKVDSTKVTNISNFYTTDPVGFTDQDRFLNCAIEIETTLDPLDLLKELQEIELKLKRVRKLRWGPRTLDIDIILFEDFTSESEILTVPHPRAFERNFVLIPLFDILKDSNFVNKHIDLKDNSVILEEKSNLLVSSCLLGDNVNYKGCNSSNYILTELLKDKFNFIKICPEVEAGMSIPRVPAEKIKDKVVQKNSTDVTRFFSKGASIALEKAEKNSIRLAILKGKSPSCGIEFIYDGTFTNKLISGNGVTSEKLLENGYDIIGVDKNEK